MTANETLPSSSSTPPTSSDLADLADVIMNVGQEIKMLGGDGKTIPLTITESNVMRYVDRHPGTSPSDLAAGTGLHRSNMSAALRGLEEKGLISRAQSADDGRVITVSPTARAAQNLELLRAGWAAGIVSAITTEFDGFEEGRRFLLRLEVGLIRSRQEQA